jgi:hypothetical protein
MCRRGSHRSRRTRRQPKLLRRLRHCKGFCKMGMAGVIGEIIALFIFVTNHVFSNNTYSIIIGPPSNLPGFDITQIPWDFDKCYINFSGKRKLVRPALAAVGLNFEVRLPSEVLETITDTEPVDFEFIDKHGIRWEIRPFYIFQRSVPLVHVGNKNQIIDTISLEPAPTNSSIEQHRFGRSPCGSSSANPSPAASSWAIRLRSSVDFPVPVCPQT